MDQRVACASGPCSTGGRELPRYDVSIILTLHDEARYLKRTLLSLEEAVLYARQFDITFEIVVVLDRADMATTRMVAECSLAWIDGSTIIHVNNGAPGPSRNDGFSIASGRYFIPMDGDDLVAYDFLHKMYAEVSSKFRSVCFPQYCCGFGENYYTYKLYGKEFIQNACFFETHPYVARIMFSRELFDEVQNADVTLKSGFAHEDWHFNCECLAAGFSLSVAAGTVVFYRERAGSMRRRFNSETSGLIPRSRFFEPDVFLKLTSTELAEPARSHVPDKPFTFAEFAALPGIPDIVGAANRIDPAISMGILRYKGASSNFVTAGPAARAYFELCRKVAGHSFTDVLLVPFFAKGGAEKYILSVIDALRELQPETRLLVIAVQKFGKHEWLERLPEGSLFVDAQALPGLTGLAIETVIFRLVQHLPGLRRLHMKNCEFVNAFARKYGRLLKGGDRIFYHFCDPVVTVEQTSFVNGQSFDLVSEAGQDFSHIISDHGRNIELIHSVIGGEIAHKTHTLYAECSLPVEGSGKRRRPMRKLLWAARIDTQKRPELLVRIAHLLEREGLDVGIDAYGGTTYGIVGPEVFCGASRLAYKGSYDGFEELPVADYDGFIYTAAFDGLPNVVLEAMAAELPVIAPDVGGIGEAVTAQTGFLIQDDTDPDRLAENFVDAIRALYNDWPEAVRRGENGRELIEQRHSRAVFLKRVGEVFDLKQSDETEPRHKTVWKTEIA